MRMNNLVGDYTIIGTNQDEAASPYRGVLTLTLNTANQIIAQWNIDNDQEQFGVGFFRDQVLVINFSYVGDDTHTYKGTVVYRCLTKNILDGFWSEEYGDPNFVGTEQCFRITEEIIN